MDINKAIIPAAGLGTRFLPFSKAVPKEMAPLINKPAIQYIIEEGLASGIKDYLMITSKGKAAIANHFDGDPCLERALKETGKSEQLASLDRILRTAHFTYIRQAEPLGLGHAIWLARHMIGKEYIGIFLPDDIIISKKPGLDQLMRIARQEKASVVAVQEVPENCVSSYGIIRVKKQVTPKLFQVSGLVEKPDPKDAPTNLAVIGRYVLSHKIFQSLEEISTYKDEGELQLTDAISHMLHNNEKVFAYKIDGTRYDLGTPIGWLKATIGMSLQDPQYAPHIRRFLADFDTPDSFMFNNEKNIVHTL